MPTGLARSCCIQIMVATMPVPDAQATGEALAICRRGDGGQSPSRGPWSFLLATHSSTCLLAMPPAVARSRQGRSFPSRMGCHRHVAATGKLAASFAKSRRRRWRCGERPRGRGDRFRALTRVESCFAASIVLLVLLSGCTHLKLQQDAAPGQHAAAAAASTGVGQPPSLFAI